MGEPDEDEWRFAVEDLPDEDGAEADGDPDVAEADGAEGAAEQARTDAAAEGGNVAGTLATDDEIEAGQPTLENAVFVALGVLVTVLLFLTMGGVL